MLGYLKSRKARGVASALPVPIPDDVPLVEGSEPSEQSREHACLKKWMELAALQQRIIAAVVGEVESTSAFVETEADGLSARFQELARSADEQTARVESLSRLAIGIEVEGKSVPIDEIARLLETTLSDVVEKILLLSKDSMSMVFALEGLNGNVTNVDDCMGRLHAITKTTNMLAMNARIEAERSGVSGATFRVIANEVRELSNATHALADSMQAEIRTVISGIGNGHTTLQRVATIDMSENILAKDRLEILLTALVARAEGLTRIVADAIVEAAKISQHVEVMVTGIQFQDRTRQRLEHVSDALRVIDKAVGQLSSETAEICGRTSSAEPSDTAWVSEMLDGFKMSDMRSRFVERLIGTETISVSARAAPEPEPSASGSVELF